LIAQKPGVQGSAIRSFLLNIQGKAASDSVSGNMSPQEIIYQQRASAVELIRQRIMLNPDSRRKPSGNGAVGIAAEHPVSSTSRRQTLDRVDGSDDSSDEELRAGHVFKNQKIVSVMFKQVFFTHSLFPPEIIASPHVFIIARIQCSAFYVSLSLCAVYSKPFGLAYFTRGCQVPAK
jgi:hypothetical protein